MSHSPIFQRALDADEAWMDAIRAAFPRKRASEVRFMPEAHGESGSTPMRAAYEGYAAAREAWSVYQRATDEALRRRVVVCGVDGFVRGPAKPRDLLMSDDERREDATAVCEAGGDVASLRGQPTQETDGPGTQPALRDRVRLQDDPVQADRRHVPRLYLGDPGAARRGAGLPDRRPGAPALSARGLRRQHRVQPVRQERHGGGKRDGALDTGSFHESTASTTTRGTLAGDRDAIEKIGINRVYRHVALRMSGAEDSFAISQSARDEPMRFRCQNHDDVLVIMPMRT